MRLIHADPPDYSVQEGLPRRSWRAELLIRKVKCLAHLQSKVHSPDDTSDCLSDPRKALKPCADDGYRCNGDKHTCWSRGVCLWTSVEGL